MLWAGDRHASKNSSSSRPGRLGGLPGGGGCRGGPWLSGLIMSPLQPPPPKLFSRPRGQLGLEGEGVLHGDRLAPKTLAHHNGVRNAPLFPRGAQKNPHLPGALAPHHSPPNGLHNPPPLYDIRQYANGQANVVKCTTGTDIQSGIVSGVLASGARQVGRRTGNIPPMHRNGVHVIPTGDHLPCGSLWRHRLHLELGHLVIGDAPQWPGIILDLNGKNGWNSNKELGKIYRNWQQIL